MTIYSLKPRFRLLLAPVARSMIRRKISADAITAAGVVLAGVAGAGVWLGRDGGAWLLLVPAGALLRTIANAVDGMVAAETRTARPLGEVLNETADRVGDISVFLPMVVVPGVPDPLVAAALATALAGSYLGLAIKAAGGNRSYAGFMGKPDRMFVVGVAALWAVADEPVTAFTAALWVVLVGGVATFGRRALDALKMESA